MLGYVSLYDIRYNVPCKLWRHSSGGPIHRLAACKSIPKISAAVAAGLGGATNSSVNPGQLGAGSSLSNQSYREVMPYTEGAYLFIAAGLNESAVWGEFSLAYFLF
jgi:hypothetical protein